MYQESEMSYDVEDFLSNWNYFMSQYKYTLPTNFLSKYGFKEIKELTDVVNAAAKGQLEGGLNRLGDVRKYLMEALKHEKEDFKGYDDDYEELDNLIQDFEEIIDDLDPNTFKQTINLASPEEKMMVRSIARQSQVKLPEEMQKEITGFIGTGGIKRKKTKSKRSRKGGRRKTIRKSRHIKALGRSQRDKSRHMKRTRGRGHK